MNISMDDLQVLVRVAHLGSFTECARERGVAVSSVSRAVDRAETAFRKRIFQRSTRSLTLTDAGRTCLEHCQNVLDELELAQQALADSDQDLRGVLRLTAPESFAQLHLLPLLGELATRAPKLEVALMNTDRSVDVVGQGMDVAIRIGRLPSSSLQMLHIAPEHRVFCASPTYLDRYGAPEHPRDLARSRCVVHGTTDVWRCTTGSGSIEEVDVRAALRVNTGDSQRAAALRGLGIARLSAWHVHEELAAGRLVRVMPDWRPVSAGVVAALYPTRRFLPRKTSLFLSLVREQLVPKLRQIAQAHEDGQAIS